jgi:hypothetical protein
LEINSEFLISNDVEDLKIASLLLISDSSLFLWCIVPIVGYNVILKKGRRFSLARLRDYG